MIAVPAQFTSQDCSGCGERASKRLSVRTHVCPSCGLVMDRDENAALNILASGRAGPSGVNVAGRGERNLRSPPFRAGEHVTLTTKPNLAVAIISVFVALALGIFIGMLNTAFTACAGSGASRDVARLSEAAERQITCREGSDKSDLMFVALSKATAWLNLIEGFWKILGQRALPGRACSSRDEVDRALLAGACDWHRQPTPFLWGRPPQPRRQLKRQFVYRI